uniref:Uncharacterized protein n=1 Tax=CrAss-like virus sp. ctXt06 TaxID=2825837 RepID=A0A8S5V6V6_9CAUD|nr:MAG TPA: hypothetical protein [CrAss-like virus sp. ctXt06]DAH00950.1 MAG TPA: hypothetical protein [Crassvirales sp.]
MILTLRQRYKNWVTLSQRYPKNSVKKSLNH